jgi:hypothetical protein
MGTGVPRLFRQRTLTVMRTRCHRLRMRRGSNRFFPLDYLFWLSRAGDSG